LILGKFKQMRKQFVRAFPLVDPIVAAASDAGAIAEVPEDSICYAGTFGISRLRAHARRM